MRVLVTRPMEDAQAIAVLLNERGHETLIAPLLSVRFHDGPELALYGVQAILATSANGVRALARRSARRDLPLFAVGPQTEEAARAAGFAEVKSADGDATALARAAADWAVPGAGAMLHVKGADGDSRLASLLTGFEVREAVLYDVAAQLLSSDAVNALRSGLLDAALFFSPRSAQIFRERVQGAGLLVASLIGVCISRSTAEALAPLEFREVRIAAKPNQAALLACLD